MVKLEEWLSMFSDFFEQNFEKEGRDFILFVKIKDFVRYGWKRNLWNFIIFWGIMSF